MPGRLVRHHPTRAQHIIGAPYEAAICTIGVERQGLPVLPDLDHIDGDWLDSRIENPPLLWACRHSQTPTHAGGNEQDCTGGRSPIR